MIIRRFIIRVPPNRQIVFTLFPSFLSNSVNRSYISRHMGLYVRKADNLIGPAPPPDAGRSGLGARYPANPCTSVPGAPSPPSDKRRKEMNGGPIGDLRSSLLIISKERIDDECSPLSPFVVNSYHLLPSRPPLARSLSALPGRPPLAFGLPADPARYAVIAA